MEELEDIITQQRSEEFELISKQLVVESDLLTALENQKCHLEATQLLEKQKSLKASLQRSQRKLAAASVKAQRAATRNREKMCIAENIIIKSTHAGEADKEDEQSVTDGSQSEATSRSGGSTLSLHDKENEAEPDEDNKKTEAEKNSNLNKDTKVLSEAEKEMHALIETGTERNRGVVMHHKKIVIELKQQHRVVLSQKVKEHRRKFQELLKDHEEEIEQIKIDQSASMKAHIMEKIELGVAPEPEQFGCVALFFTDIYGFKKLVGQVDAVQILKLLNMLYTGFDTVISRYALLYKVETVSDTYMVASGLGSQATKTAQEIAECTIQSLACAIELQKLVHSMDFSSIVGNIPINLRIGIHAGSLNAGLIGLKMSRYCLFGDTVNTASRMCTTGEPARIQVSAQTIAVLGDDDRFEFEERGEIEVKGKGKMTTFWLHHD
ncbi:Retinal guanylyl cyclase 2 [Podochytrium sp. JEL0797]|nr:Retinal guanylyl cyclase 2 [Podochytrium sp. JEL0797]